MQYYSIRYGRMDQAMNAFVCQNNNKLRNSIHQFKIGNSHRREELKTIDKSFY